MHVGTKASTLGAGFIVVATALHFGEVLITVKLIALLVIYFFTSSMGIQVFAYAARVSKVPVVQEMWLNELAVSDESES
jgi:multisubunit Na+/H+ antiporter MnhG subunit